jgi:hypothetical protein
MDEAHRLAMEAKEKIFQAQDAIGYPDSEDGEQLRKLLGTLRADLENYDRAARRELRNRAG